MAWIILIGAAAFGLVVGWCASLAVARSKSFRLKELSALIAIVGGGAVTALFKDPMLFACYSIGMAVTFFVHRFISMPTVSESINKSISKGS